MYKRFSLISGFALSLFLASESWSFGLGALTLYSHLNEPFSAKIALLEADALEASDLQIGLASPAEFVRVGIKRDLYLTKIAFEIESDSDGKRVSLKTETPLREPYLQLVVEASWPDGRLLKEYTVLIDLPPSSRSLSNTRTEVDHEPMPPEGNEVDTGIGGYTGGTLDRPLPGARYLVEETDTLWRIASEAAVDGASIEQTMLEIVAANPAAFQDGNVNGLKAGYVLQLPDVTDIRIDVASALDEVAQQHDEWAFGGTGVRGGLTLVADNDTPVTGDPTSSDVFSEPDGGLNSRRPMENTELVPDSGIVEQAELDLLITTVGQLQASIEMLQARLAEQDAELARLRARLVAQNAVDKPRAPSTRTEVSTTSEAFGLLPSRWLLTVGALVLLVTGAFWAWSRRRDRSQPLSDVESPDDDVEIDELRSTTAGLAARFVEDAEVLIAYGRVDQAIEVLRDAITQGLSSASLTLLLLECYLEAGLTDEASIVVKQLEQSGDPELLAEARRRLVDADVGSDISARPNDAKPAVGLEDSPAGDGAASKGDLSMQQNSPRQTSAFSLTPLEADASAEPSGEEDHESIFGSETDPMDSQLDLARAYIDMGDDEGAKPVLMIVIKEGDLSQQAEARELLLRIEVL